VSTRISCCHTAVLAEDCNNLGPVRCEFGFEYLDCIGAAAHYDAVDPLRRKP